MNELKYLKNTFCQNAVSFPIIDAKTRFWLAIILLLNIAYIIANGHHVFSNLGFISNRTLNTIAFGLSAGGFILVLRNYLNNTLDFSVKRLKRSVVYANIAYISGYIIYWAYNTIMSVMKPSMGGDVQKIRQITKIDFANYCTLVTKYIFSVINEELIIFAVFLIALSFFKPKVRNTLFSVFIALLFFGLLHVSAWNWATVPAVMFNKLIPCLLMIFFMDLKPLYIAHLFNNCFVSLSIIQGMTGNIRNWIFFLFLVPLIVFVSKHTISDISKQDE